MFGTQMTDEFFAVNTGGDLAFLNGVLKVLLADGAVDRDFVRDHTERVRRGRRRARPRVVRRPRAAVGRDPRRHGALRADVRGRAVGRPHLVDGDHPARARRRQRRCDRQPRSGARQRRAARRRAHAHPRSLRRAGRLRDGRLRHRVPRRASRSTPRTPPRCRERYGFPIGDQPGHHRRGDGRGRRARRDRRALFVGRQLPRGAARPRRRSKPRLARVPLRVHQDIVLSSQMFIEPGEVVVLLPAATRYEQRDGGTETTTERRDRVQPRDPGPASG